MRGWVLASILAAGVAALPHLQAGVDDGDTPRKQRGPADSDKERQAFLTRLGAGPVYQVDILYRGAGDGRIYLCQTLLSPQRPWARGGIAGLGVDAKGNPLPPSDLGFKRVERVAELAQSVPGVIGVPAWCPPAATTREVHAHLDPQLPGQLGCFSSDVGTGMPLPAKAGDANILMFHACLFRVQLLTTEQLAAYQPLRQDAIYFRARTALLRKELLTTYRTRLDRDDHLAGAALLLREEALFERVRKRCRAWIDRPNGKTEDARRLANVLAVTGDPADVALLHEWVKRRPEDVPWLTWTVLNLTARFGPGPAMPLLTELLRDPASAIVDTDTQRLLDFDASLPMPTRGDHFLLSLLEQNQRRPDDFGMKSVPAHVLAARLTFSVADRKRVEAAAKRPRPSGWLFVTSADRARGVGQVLQWLAARK